MTISDFNREYKKQGGLVMLTEFRAGAMSESFIAEHYGVSKERVSQWFKEFFKEDYDPRPTRRQRIVEAMLAFASKSTEEEFKEAFKPSNKDYFVYALSECYRLGIFKKEEATQ